ncbi:MAG: hypothetical protein OEY52_14435 [Gammaproteobacteria bacterium]|nr:hypothetical protein [Gammaproteobacteria bacterium]
MFVLEKESGDVVAMTTGGIETRISVIEAKNGRYILAIDAPPETIVESIDPENEESRLEQALRANYRHELLMF